MQQQAAENSNKNKKVAAKLILLQIVITLLGSLAGLLIGGSFLAYSACLGGAIGIIGTLLLGVIMFSGKDMSPKQMLFAFYLGEATKICVTIALFIVVFVLMDVHILSFMLTYIAALAVNWLSLLITGN